MSSGGAGAPAAELAAPGRTPVRRIGLLGGSFDPVHAAHIALARVALDRLALDELRWVPAGQPWQKSRELAPAADRAAMVELAIAGEARWRLDRCELRRDGPTYTVDTLVEVQAAAPNADWYLVLGQDQYANLATWHRWPELLQRVTLAVAGRDGVAVAPSAEMAGVPHRVVALPMPRVDVSSSAVRARVAAGEDIADMVPPTVARYIDQHGLYRGHARS